MVNWSLYFIVMHVDLILLFTVQTTLVLKLLWTKQVSTIKCISLIAHKLDGNTKWHLCLCISIVWPNWNWTFSLIDFTKKNQLNICLQSYYKHFLLINAFYSQMLSNQWTSEGMKENVLFNNTLNTFYLRLYGVRHMVKNHSDCERGNLLPPHGLLLPISSKVSFICSIPQTWYHTPQPLLNQSWSTSWNETSLNMFWC